MVGTSGLFWPRLGLGLGWALLSLSVLLGCAGVRGVAAETRLGGVGIVERWRELRIQGAEWKKVGTRRIMGRGENRGDRVGCWGCGGVREVGACGAKVDKRNNRS